MIRSDYSYEKDLYDWLRVNLPGHFMRLEVTTESGVPDINVCNAGQEAWIECKLRQPDGETYLRKYQYAWGTRGAIHNRRTFIISYDRWHDQILIWRFPLKEEPIMTSRGLRIMDLPMKILPRDREGLVQLKILLFPGCN